MVPLRSIEQLWLPLDGQGPLQSQIYQSLRDRIARGELDPGVRLPSTRGLARDLGVSRNTTQIAYDQLIAEGYLVTRVGSGTFVAPEIPDLTTPPAKAAEAAPEPRHVRLSGYGRRIVDRGLGSPYERIRELRPVPYEFLYGIPDPRIFPRVEWRRLVSAHSHMRTVYDLAYGPPAGVPQLREAIASYLEQARGIRTGAESVVVVSGIQQGLELMTRLLCDPGDAVLVEDPCYPGARNTLIAQGVDIAPGPVDGDGIDLRAVDPIALGRARLAYVTPSHQFPTGAVMTFPRRQALLSWAEESGAYIFEDDYDSEFRYQGRPIESLRALDDRGRVIYAGTFSKTLFPALRIGYLVLPPELVAPVGAAKWLASFCNPTLEQLVLGDFLRDGHFERHLRRARLHFARRRAALLEELSDHFGSRCEIEGENAGLHVLLWLRDVPGREVDELCHRAREKGVGVYPARDCYRDAPERAGLILGYTLVDEAGIAEGIRRLAECV